MPLIPFQFFYINRHSVLCTLLVQIKFSVIIADPLFIHICFGHCRYSLTVSNHIVSGIVLQSYPGSFPNDIIWRSLLLLLLHLCVLRTSQYLNSRIIRGGLLSAHDCVRHNACHHQCNVPTIQITYWVTFRIWFQSEKCGIYNWFIA
eukprot:975084_1